MGCTCARLGLSRQAQVCTEAVQYRQLRGVTGFVYEAMGYPNPAGTHVQSNVGIWGEAARVGLQSGAVGLDEWRVGLGQPLTGDGEGHVLLASLGGQSVQRLRCCKGRVLIEEDRLVKEGWSNVAGVRATGELVVVELV